MYTTTSVTISTENKSPIFTFAGEINATATTVRYRFNVSRMKDLNFLRWADSNTDTRSVYSNREDPVAPIMSGSESDDLLNILHQQEPRVADTAPTAGFSSASEMDDIWPNYRRNRSDTATQDEESFSSDFPDYNRTQGASSSAWSDVNRNNSRHKNTTDPFDFLVKSISSANNFVSSLTREQLSVMRAMRPSLLYELLLEVADARRDDWHIRRALPTECAFCKNNGESEEYYTQHVLKDWRGRVICPVLRAFHCPRCGATGDRAHTIKYCPEPDLGHSNLASRRRVPPSYLLLGETSATRQLPTPAAPSPTPVSSPLTRNLSYSTLWSNFNLK